VLIWRFQFSFLYMPGLYQIGLVYARSWVDVGAPSGISIPNRNAS
jgi:hypothetical protein